MNPTQTEVFAPAGAISAAVGPALAALAEQVRPSVVQIRSGGRGSGTGVIWRADGAILTNDHVVAHARGNIQVQLTDGRRFDGTVGARAPELDLAIIQIDARDLPAATVGNSSELRLGELVLALGHPWGQPWVVTAGIISGLGEATVQSRNGERQAAYIRSDVRLAPGNSGGPLLNTRGEVIGINAMVFGGDLSVAIPSHVASSWTATSPQAATKPRLGVGVQAAELPASMRQGAWAKRRAGLLVVGVDSGTPAERAPLLVGDLLLDVAGIALEDAAALRNVLNSHTGGTLRFYLLRAGAVLAVDVLLG